MSTIRWLGRRPLLNDLLFALALGAITILGSVPAGRDQIDMTQIDGLAYALLVVGALALALRRRAPASALAIAFAATAVWIWLRYPYGPIFLYVMVGIYSLAAWRRAREAIIAVALILLAHIPWSMWGEDQPDSLAFAVVTTSLWLVCPLAVGMAVRGQRHAVAHAMEEERGRHLSEERLRIAQEVHDVVGHSLAVISMNAGAALHVLSRQPGPAQVAESLRAIRAASSGALDELRAALLAHEGPSLAALPDLLEATRVDGLSTELMVTGERADIPSKVDLTGYRIVQESLTNVVRHAGASHARVAVDYQPGRVTLTVTDDGHGGPVRPGGSGLASMTARAEALGGTLAAGALPAATSPTATLAADTSAAAALAADTLTADTLSADTVRGAALTADTLPADTVRGAA